MMEQLCPRGSKAAVLVAVLFALSVAPTAKAEDQGRREDERLKAR